jgi:hypothetical protein
MKLRDLVRQLEEQKQQKGSYSGVRFDTETNKALHEYMKENKIPNAIRPDKLHTTVLYSRKYLPNYKPAGKITPPWTATPGDFTVWETNGENGPKTKCLILQYDCPELVSRHKSLMKEHEATFDYPEYKPHITLSYDVDNLDVSKLPRLADRLKQIRIAEEYGEDLDLNWAKNKGAKGG